jgi:hypothetical protein
VLWRFQLASVAATSGRWPAHRAIWPWTLLRERFFLIGSVGFG